MVYWSLKIMIFGLCCLAFINCVCFITFILGTTSLEKCKLEKAEKARQIVKELDVEAYKID